MILEEEAEVLLLVAGFCRGARGALGSLRLEEATSVAAWLLEREAELIELEQPDRASARRTASTLGDCACSLDDCGFAIISHCVANLGSRSGSAHVPARTPPRAHQLDARGGAGARVA